MFGFSLELRVCELRFFRFFSKLRQLRNHLVRLDIVSKWIGDFLDLLLAGVYDQIFQLLDFLVYFGV